jgi:hypothetical protein
MAMSVNKQRPVQRALTDARAAGVYGGTGFAGIVLLLPDGLMKSILLVLSPTITLIISSSWHLLIHEIDSRVADWRIRSQKQRVQKLLKALKEVPDVNAELVRQAQEDLDALMLLEVEISRKRVQAIVTS